MVRGDANEFFVLLVRSLRGWAAINSKTILSVMKSTGIVRRPQKWHFWTKSTPSFRNSLFFEEMKNVFFKKNNVALSTISLFMFIFSRTETPWHSIHGHGWSMAVPSLARPGPRMDQGWQSPLLSLARDGPSLARPGNQKSGKLKTAYRSSVFWNFESSLNQRKIKTLQCPSQNCRKNFTCACMHGSFW